MRKRIVTISLCLILVVAFTNACTPKEMEQLEGILQNVDVASGEITIVTKDGQTKTFSIDTEDSVEAAEVLSALETLEVGDYIQIEVNEDNQVVQSVEAQQTEAEGVTAQIDGDESAKEEEIVTGSETVTEEVEEEEKGEEEEDAEPDAEDKTDVEPSVDGEVVPGGNKDIIGDAVPGGDVDIDGDGKITIVDVVGGLEAERARLAEAIAENRISGYYDAEWIRNAEAERERLAEEIERALSDDTYIVVEDGRWLIMDIDPIGDLPDPVNDDPPDDGDDHGDDGDDHGDDDHGDDGDDGDDHGDDGDDGGDDGDDGGDH